MAVEQAIESTDTVETKSGALTDIFRGYREERGLNINQVAEALCLSPKIITALETEQLDKLPEPPYVRGYLRSYAKFAEVDPASMIAAYEKLRGAKPNELDYHFEATPSSSRKKGGGFSSGMLKLGLIVLLLGLLAILSMIPGVKNWASDTWNSFSQDSNPSFTDNNQTNNPLLTGSIPAPLPIDDPSITGNLAALDSDPAATGTAVLSTDGNVSFPSVDDGTATESTDAASTEGDTAETSATEPETETAEGDTDATETPEGSSRLTMTFTDEVWMRIRDKEQKRLFEGLSQKGDTKDMVLPKPMVIRVGNAQKLELMVDGEPFDMTPFINGSIANFTIE